MNDKNYVRMIKSDIIFNIDFISHHSSFISHLFLDVNIRIHRMILYEQPSRGYIISHQDFE